MERKPTKHTRPFIIIPLDTKSRLSQVIALMKENLRRAHLWKFRPRSTEAIIKDVFEDLNKYWQAWYDMPKVEADRFADFLAIHRENDGNDTDEDVRVRELRYHVFRERTLSALRDAASGQLSFFLEGRELLQGMNDSELTNGWKREYGSLSQYRTRNLSEVLLKPGEALEWFARTSTYTDLLPSMLCDWLYDQTAELKTAGDPRSSEDEGRKAETDQQPDEVEEEAVKKVLVGRGEIQTYISELSGRPPKKPVSWSAIKKWAKRWPECPITYDATGKPTATEAKITFWFNKNRQASKK